MSYIWITGAILCLAGLAIIFPWLLLIAGLIWFVYLLEGE